MTWDYLPLVAGWMLGGAFSTWIRTWVLGGDGSVEGYSSSLISTIRFNVERRFSWCYGVDSLFILC